MKNIYHILFFIALFFMLSLLIRNGSTNAEQIPVKPLPTGEYGPQLLKELKNAQSSIHAAVYLAKFSEDISYAIENKILKELVKADKRGVEVRIILDRNFTFTDEDPEDTLSERNQAAYRYLKNNGINVLYDTSDTLTHTKLVVIDSKKVILGSSNWTYSGVSRNNEANVLINSKKTARAFLELIEKIKVNREKD